MGIRISVGMDGIAVSGGGQRIQVGKPGPVTALLNDKPVYTIVVGCTPLKESINSGFHCRKRKQGQRQRNTVRRPSVIYPEFGETVHLVLRIIAVLIRNNADILVWQMEKPGAAGVIAQVPVLFGRDRAAIL